MPFFRNFVVGHTAHGPAAKVVARRLAVPVAFALAAACGSESSGVNAVVPVGGPGGATDAGGKSDAASSDGGASDSGTPGVVDSGGGGVNDSGGGVDAALPACVIDGFAWTGTEYKVVAKGRMWTLDGGRALVGAAAGTDLRALAGMSAGPCAGQGTVCRLDGLTWNANNNVYYAVFGAKYWHLDSGFALTGPGAAGALLDGVPGLATGPCAGQTSGNCRIESIAWQDGKGLFITNGGKAWAYDGSGNPIGPSTGTALTSFTGLVSMCAAVGGTCPVDDLVWRNDVAQFQYLAGGKYWATDTTTAAVSGSGADLRSISGFASGPCAP